MDEHSLQGSYGYFMGANHGKTYDECLLALRLFNDNRRAIILKSLLMPFSKIIIKYSPWHSEDKLHIKEYIQERGPVYEWQFTLPDATNRAIASALNKDKALYALEQYICPLEFAFKLRSTKCNKTR